MSFASDPERAKLNNIAEWSAVDAKRIEFTNEEKKLRSHIIAENFPEPGDKKTHNKVLDANHKLTVEFPTNFKIVHPESTDENKISTEKAAHALEDAIMKASPNEGSFIVERLISWEPKLSVSEYKKLSPTMKAVVDKFVQTSAGTPTAKINPIKT